MATKLAIHPIRVESAELLNHLFGQSIMTPKKPVVLVWKDKTTLSGYAPDRPMTTTLLAAVSYSRQKENLVLYDSAGNQWKCANVSLSTGPLTWLHRLAVMLFVNPTRQCLLSWSDPTPYDLKRLRKTIRQEIVTDDDILTQFRSKKECHDIVDQATSAEDLIVRNEKMNTEEPEQSTRTLVPRRETDVKRASERGPSAGDS